MTPSYPIGAKRILFSDHYYPAISRSNVRLETNAIRSFTPTGILFANGLSHDIDAVIFATGFRTNPFLDGIQISAYDQLLSEHWRNGAHAYLGIMTYGFPNLFMLYGPNTNLGHNSLLIMSEAQAKYITQIILGIKEQHESQIEVQKDTEERYNQEIQNRLKKSSWNTIDKSWYQIDGKITNNWPGRTMEYVRKTRIVKWSDYQIT